MGITFQILSEEERSHIAEATFSLLESVGIELTEPEARQLLREAGARIEGPRVYIPRELVGRAIHTAPSAIEIFDRNGDVIMTLGEQRAYFGAHTDAPEVLDPISQERRPCLEADVIKHARLVDSLPEIHFATASGLVADRPAAIGDRVSLASCLKHTTKPVLAMPVSRAALLDSMEMSALAVGSEEALRERPFLIVYAEPVSPLLHPDESVEKLLTCAEHQIPLVYSGFAAMGGTAPMSPAGVTAQLCAETLSGLVIHQLKRPGAPYIFGGMASIMDMRTTVFSFGAPEFQRGNTLMTEMAHTFNLPNFGTAGTSDAQVLDGQAIAEVSSSCLMAVLAGGDLIHDIGLLGNASVVMPEMILASSEIVDMIRRLLRNVAVDGEALALDVIREVGPGGEFVTHDHTFDHFKDVWYPELFYRGGEKAWHAGRLNATQIPFEGRLQARALALMEAHQPQLLPEAVAGEIDSILARAEEREE